MSAKPGKVMYNAAVKTKKDAGKAKKALGKFAFKSKRRLAAACTAGVTAAVLLLTSCSGDGAGRNGTKPFEADGPQMVLSEVFGKLFYNHVDFEGPALEGSRPDENMDIPFDQTKLSRAFNMLDKRYLYIEGTSFIETSTGSLVKIERVYAIQDSTIYIGLNNGREDYHLISDGKQVVGLDFEKRTYTEIPGLAYTVDELLYTGGYEFCTSVGTDILLGEAKLYEDFTVYVSADTMEWIRYYFNDDESLAGYIRYVNNEPVEIMKYDYMGSDYPEDVRVYSGRGDESDADVYFAIPKSFKKEDIIIDWSEFFGD